VFSLISGGAFSKLICGSEAIYKDTQKIKVVGFAESFDHESTDIEKIKANLQVYDSNSSLSDPKA